MGKIGAFVEWGIVIYAVLRLVGEGLVTYHSSVTMSYIATIVVLFILCITAGRSLRFHSWQDILPYSISWAVISGVLDAVYVVPYFGWSIYADWNVWISYVLVAIFPLLAPHTRRIGTDMPDIT